MLTICLALVLVSLAISLPLTAWLIGRGGHVDQPGSEAHKQHTAAVPNSGGIAIFAAIVIPQCLALAVAWGAPLDLLTGPLAPLRDHLPGIRSQTAAIVALLVAITIMHVLGRVDDRKRLSAKFKLGVQLLVAAGLVIGFDIRVLHLLDAYGPAGSAASIAISILWIAVITNAMNMLDNMDGLSAGVGAIIAVLYLAATLIGGQWFVAAVCAMIIGALLGFLFFNFHPARIFMGDGGSLVIGLLLAVVSIRTTYFTTSPGEAQPAAWYGLLMPVMLLAVPLYDFTSVTLIRLSQGRSPFVGDRNHFSHRLVRKGLSVRAAVIVIWLCTLATGLSGVMLSSLTPWQAALAGAQTVAVIAVLALLERAGAVELDP